MRKSPESASSWWGQMGLSFPDMGTAGRSPRRGSSKPLALHRHRVGRQPPMGRGRGHVNEAPVRLRLRDALHKEAEERQREAEDRAHPDRITICGLIDGSSNSVFSARVHTAVPPAPGREAKSKDRASVVSKKHERDQERTLGQSQFAVTTVWGRSSRFGGRDERRGNRAIPTDTTSAKGALSPRPMPSSVVSSSPRAAGPPKMRCMLREGACVLGWHLALT